MKKRLLAYILLFIVYCFLAVPIATLDDILNTHQFELVTGLGFGILNFLFSFIVLKWKIIFSVISGLFIAFLALAMANLTWLLKIAPEWDDYGIMTAILTNAASSIVFWEIIFWSKSKSARIFNK
ncbi:hypothetical protein SAMN05421594_0827 [Chryseobacterium oleae]|uniref:4 TMS phage holin, superfamily IV n=1 Tax=Chryseobacterium oleae TaxID=491207 RepID=A0A1I4W1Z6_CHROL|nr:hypothetical protein [Chryseobacterium oleae]SFN07503.1 hypothetical protein SAMN05421594_0827 [Chryseobacterium oleae]